MAEADPRQSRREHRASSGEHSAVSIQHPAFSIQHPAFIIGEHYNIRSSQVDWATTYLLSVYCVYWAHMRGCNLRIDASVHFIRRRARKQSVNCTPTLGTSLEALCGCDGAIEGEHSISLRRAFLPAVRAHIPAAHMARREATSHCRQGPCQCPRCNVSCTIFPNYPAALRPSITRLHQTPSLCAPRYAVPLPAPRSAPHDRAQPKSCSLPPAPRETRRPARQRPVRHCVCRHVGRVVVSRTSPHLTIHIRLLPSPRRCRCI